MRIFSALNGLKNSQGAKKYLKNTSWLFLEKLFRMVVGLFVGIWIARYLGPDQFGLFSFVQSFVLIFTIVASLGLDGILVRELVKSKSNQQADGLLGTAFTLKLIAAILAILLLVIALLISQREASTFYLAVIIASATIFQSLNVIDFYFQSKVLSKYVVFANFLALLSSSITKITLIVIEAPLVAFAWVILFESVVLSLGLVYFYLSKNLSTTHWHFKRSIALQLLKDSWPLLLSSFVTTIYMKIDQIMIENFISNEAVGQYAAAARLSEAWYVIPTIIVSSLFPAIINAKEQSNQLYIARIKKLYQLMVVIALAIAIPTTFLSDWVIRILYGEAYHQSGDILTIHIWSALFLFLLVASGRWMIAENYVKQALYRNTAGVVTNVGLNIYFIDKFGIIGAAYATLISYAVSGFIYDLFSKELRISFFMKVNALSFNTLYRDNK